MRVSWVLGIAGSRTSDGELAGNACTARVSAPSGRDRETNLRTRAGGRRGSSTGCGARSLLPGSGDCEPDHHVYSRCDCSERKCDEERSFVYGSNSRGYSKRMPVCAGRENRTDAGFAWRRYESDWGGESLALSILRSVT